MGGRHEVRAVEPDPLVTSGPRGCDQLIEHRATHPGAAMGRLDVHALDLGGVGPDPPHAGRADGHVALEGQQEATVGRLELGDRREVVIHGFLDGESEPVPRLQLVVAPREVVEPQAPDRLQISRQDRVSKIGHVTGPIVTGDAQANWRMLQSRMAPYVGVRTAIEFLRPQAGHASRASRMSDSTGRLGLGGRPGVARDLTRWEAVAGFSQSSYSGSFSPRA